MAGTVTVRCGGCRKPVMVADRDGRIGGAWDATMVTDVDGTPIAVCALCGAPTPWRRLVAPTGVPSVAYPLAEAHVRNLAICLESSHDPIDARPPPTGMVAQRTCRRCGSVYAEGGAA